ncbi:M13 family metallopeptidase [Corynebacterium pyruviciproducens]|uniref:M13 family metallopeptidase n=1 Tax=Corynebacterium pyruviciproducens TaxID=598660 RepID=UPI0023F26A89|nr:M13-type metalloendopeptidase [Corynebacterium pyruviciproducens]
MKDLFEIVNGEWYRETEIPAEYASWGTFQELRLDSLKQCRGLAEADEGLVGTAYRSFMEHRGEVSDLEFDYLDKPLPEALGELDKIGVTAPASFFVEKSADSEDAVAYIVQAGLGLPDEAYYHAPEHAETLKKYEEHVARMLELTGRKEKATDVLAVEHFLAQGHWDNVACRDAVKTFNPVELSSLGDNVQTMLRTMGLDDGTVIACQPSYLEHLETAFSELSDEQWRAWAVWHIVSSRAGLLSDDLSAANFDFYGRVLSGSEKQRDRWQRALGFVEGGLGFELGKLYAAEYFPESSKKEMLELVGYLLTAYRERISHLDWMTEATRDKALAKLELFTSKIGYPDEWRTYDIELSEDDLVGNSRALALNAHNYHLSKLGKPYDRGEWVMTPQTVNACYNPTVNDITFPGAILQAPFYSPSHSPAENFGGIGAVIGHEIGHGFDDQGSRYDGHGSLEVWWTDEDRAAFEKLTAALVGQFQGLVPIALEGQDTPGVNGELTLGENIGDLGGLGIALVAYKKYAADHGEDVDLVSFFTSWGKSWRQKTRPQMAAQLLAIDPHSPSEFRCSVIPKNIDEFYEAFDVEDGFAPEERVTIW